MHQKAFVNITSRASLELQFAPVVTFDPIHFPSFFLSLAKGDWTSASISQPEPGIRPHVLCSEDSANLLTNDSMETRVLLLCKITAVRPGFLPFPSWNLEFLAFQ